MGKYPKFGGLSYGKADSSGNNTYSEIFSYRRTYRCFLYGRPGDQQVSRTLRRSY